MIFDLARRPLDEAGTCKQDWTNGLRPLTGYWL